MPGTLMLLLMKHLVTSESPRSGTLVSAIWSLSRARLPCRRRGASFPA